MDINFSYQFVFRQILRNDEMYHNIFMKRVSNNTLLTIWV